jgi:hypothetical protein
VSRSRKKSPILTCAKSYGAKTVANGVVRRSKTIYNGGYYKKLYNSWDICDYKWRIDKKDITWKILQK